MVTFFDGGSADYSRAINPRDLSDAFVSAKNQLIEEAQRTSNAHIPAPPPVGSAWGEPEFHHGDLGVHYWTMPCDGTYPADDEELAPADLKIKQPRYSDLIWSTMAIETFIQNRNRPDKNRGMAEIFEFTGPTVQLDIDWVHDLSMMILFAWQTLAQPFWDAGMLPYTELDCDDNHNDGTNIMTARKRSD